MSDQRGLARTICIVTFSLLISVFGTGCSSETSEVSLPLLEEDQNTIIYFVIDESDWPKDPSSVGQSGFSAEFCTEKITLKNENEFQNIEFKERVVINSGLTYLTPFKALAMASPATEIMIELRDSRYDCGGAMSIENSNGMFNFSNNGDLLTFKGTFAADENNRAIKLNMTEMLWLWHGAIQSTQIQESFSKGTFEEELL